MSMFDEKHVITGNGAIVWDGVTKPTTNDSDKLVHNVKVALLPGSVELAEINKIVQDALNADPTFKGVLPPGGQLPCRVSGTDVEAPDPSLVGHILINAKTHNGAPQVYNIDGKVLDPMAYSGLLYPGAIVRLLVHAFSYDKKGNKGVALALDGVQIVDASVPKLNIGGGVDAGAAFGGQPGSVAGAVPGMARAATPPIPATVPPVPATVPPVPATVPPVPATVPPVPAPDFLSPPVMTAKAAGATYESFVQNQWTDKMLVEHGYMMPRS